MSAPPGWKFGDPPTEEMKAKAAEGRRNSIKNKKTAKSRPPRPARPRLETAPTRVGGTVSEKMRRKIVSLLARVIQGVDATAVWTMRRMERPVYAIDVTTKKIMLDERKRPIIEGKVRAVSDETINADRLEEWERNWLAEELVNELIQYKRVRTFLVRMVELEERSSLPMCVTILALPRLARHGILPAEFSEMIEGLREAARRARHAPRSSEPITPPAPEPEIPSAAAAAD